MGKIFSNFSIQFFKHDFHFKLYIRQRKCFYQIVQQYLFEKLEHLPSKDSLFRRNCKLSTTLEENQQLKTRKVRLLIIPLEIIIIVKHHFPLNDFNFKITIPTIYQNNGKQIVRSFLISHKIKLLLHRVKFED